MKSKEIRKTIYDWLAEKGLRLDKGEQKELKRLIIYQDEVKTTELRERIIAFDKQVHKLEKTIASLKRSKPPKEITTISEPKPITLVQPDSFSKPTGIRKVRIF